MSANSPTEPGRSWSRRTAARLAYVQTQPQLCVDGDCQGQPDRVAIMDVDGSNEIVLPNPVTLDAPDPWYLGSGLLWSPDGQRLLYMAYSEGPYALVSVAVKPGSPPVIYPVMQYLYLADIADVTWQPVLEARSSQPKPTARGCRQAQRPSERNG